MGKLMVDGENYTGLYLGSYPEAKNQIYNAINSLNIKGENVQSAIDELDAAIGDVSSLAGYGNGTVSNAVLALGAKIAQMNAIASGATTGKVFDTFGEMETWMKSSANRDLLPLGANIYIKAKNVPDYWISEVLSVPDPNTGYYYGLSTLESDSTNITDYSSIIGKTVITGISDGTLTGAVVALNNGKVSKTDFNNSMGTTDISSIGDGTLTGAISALSASMVTSSGAATVSMTDLGTDVSDKIGTADISSIGDGTITGAISVIYQALQNAGLI